ncbi:hypothetical protein BU24DRAFT_101496 [Aaosphaeria arxii CBS 175.79]|uniref:Uncharacterized protein n=1 Tax=Aaosphaeria arxii CBS 175.79 TaxID=1450172 RepID=A0A6A5Y0A4_9PLEO|nr:uncharacterized protein BU24DRAFT_101496 [Aaosphaeria arxii CBS 175.79]KAF2018656.1 hypothetical protein BU24DRAFT_101496 [Aaosphaeria arxii CBS 175.79]
MHQRRTNFPTPTYGLRSTVYGLRSTSCRYECATQQDPVWTLQSRDSNSPSFPAMSEKRPTVHGTQNVGVGVRPHTHMPFSPWLPILPTEPAVEAHYDGACGDGRHSLSRPRASGASSPRCGWSAFAIAYCRLPQTGIARFIIIIIIIAIINIR